MRIMRHRFSSACSLFVIAVAALGASRGGQSAQFKFAQQTLTVPDGFEVELVAGPPLVDRPIIADFDEQGRLYVADSAGVNDKPDKQLQNPQHRIVRLEDTDGDGRFDKSVVFADKMMFPEGLLWYDGAVYCGAPPSIWKLEDTNGDGIADRRTEWFKGMTLTGCANDLHGPYLGPDGWIYWCKGAFAKQTHERPDRPTISDSAAHIFRCRPDGSEFDSVMSGGMDNPVEVVFTPAGEAIFTTTFYTNPEGGRRDALVHAIYGGVYPKVHGVLDGLKRTGELMPAMVHLGPAAPCGLVRYESRVFGGEYQDNLFSTQFNLRRVQRHVLAPEGATFHSVDTDFVTSDSPDFHPTHILEDADGSLLVVDTGGWYKLCCPTSQLAKPDVLGAIYRVRRRGAAGVDDPRGLKLDWKGMHAPALVKLLNDPRPAVRKRALLALGKHGEKAVPALAKAVKKEESALGRLNAIWALTRIDGSAAREAARVALKDRDADVRQAAVYSAGIRRDQLAVTNLLEWVKSGSPHLQCASATSLGQIGSRTATPALLDAAAVPTDRALEHALIFALIEIDDHEAVATGLRAASPNTRRAALIALDQMDRGGLAVADVAPLLASADSTLKATAAWIVEHHSEWGRELVGHFRQRLAEPGQTEAQLGELERQLSRLSHDAAIQQLLAASVVDASVAKPARLTALRVIAQAQMKDAPVAWTMAVIRVLEEGDSDLTRQAVATARGLTPPKNVVSELSAALLRVAQTSAVPAAVRLDALAAVPGGLSQVEPPVFDFLRANLEPGTPVLTRTAAASVLGGARLSPGQLLALTDSLKGAGPLEVSRLIAAYRNGGDEALGLRLVSALKASAGVSGLRADLIRPALAKFPASAQRAGEDLLASLNADAAQQKARLEQMLTGLKGGDIRRGQAVFSNPKAACSTCHEIGYLGGHVGPDLTHIGQIRTERDLLESIVFPSASFVRSFEPMVVVTKGGDQFNGIPREAGDELSLVTGPGPEIRLARADIAEMRPSAVSVMPGGLADQLSAQELADLIEFLKANK